jgi:hypothetical protein
MEGNQNFKIDSKVFKWVPTSVWFFNFPMDPGWRQKAIHTTRHGTLPLPHAPTPPPIEDSRAQPTHDFLSGFLPVFFFQNSWWSLPRVILTQDAKYTHRALSGALSGPDSAALRRTLSFCCRVWLFDYGNYSNTKKSSLFSFPKSMPAIRTMCMWKVQISNLLFCSKTKTR